MTNPDTDKIDDLVALSDEDIQKVFDRIRNAGSETIRSIAQISEWGGTRYLTDMLRDRPDYVQAIVVSSNVFNNSLSDKFFLENFSPSPNHRDLSKGAIGHLCRVPVLSSVYQHPDLQLSMARDSFIIVTAKHLYEYFLIPNRVVSSVPTTTAKASMNNYPVNALDEGHKYQLIDGQELRFIKKQKDQKTGEFVTIHTGTTNEELLEILIDRTSNLNRIMPGPENALAIHHMQSALDVFNARTAARKAQNVEGTPMPHTPDPKLGLVNENSPDYRNEQGMIMPIARPVSADAPNHSPVENIGRHDASAIPESVTSGDRHAVFTDLQLKERGQTKPRYFETGTPMPVKGEKPEQP